MNEQFNNEKYMLVKVRYTEDGSSKFTYAVKKTLRLRTGDYAVVTTGSGHTLNSMKVVEVMAHTTNIKKNLPTFEIKEVLDKVCIK